MPEPFKNLLNPAAVRQAALHLQRHAPAFDPRRFEQLAVKGLQALEMKARAMHIADVLEATLPPDFDAAATLIEASLAPVLNDQCSAEAGLAGWILWPVGEFVARRGLAQPRRALATLHALTQRFTAEWAIRPFIEAHPQLCFDTLAKWATDPSPHVRRLVSEGSRPRLPWGLRLKRLVEDPSPTLPLLLALQDDPSEYVRRSVANHLNDIAKDHPDLVARWVERHLPGASDQRRALLRHASRTLIKSGHPPTLQAWGLAETLRGEATLKISPRRLALGETLNLQVTICSTALHTQRLVLDYKIHHVKANGATTPKVFKGWSLALGANERRALQKTHSLRPITTRRYHAGRHVIDLQVNGKTVARTAFELKT
ncbi:MAG: DNA alkylation repair protein [Rhizobacter sp.]|nr:DNA alkylation repair protein [Rhizobacter sp.]